MSERVEGWTAIPSWLIRSSDLTTPELCVLLVLMSRINADGVCWPKTETIAKESRTSKRTVLRALASLKERGLVSWERRVDDDGSLTSSLYRTHLETAGRRGGGATESQGVVTERHKGGATVAQKQDPPNKTNSEEKEETPSSADAPEISTGSALIADPLVQAVERVCEHLVQRISADGSRKPTITKAWRDAARLLMTKDGRTEEQVHLAIDWCQDHAFWHSNILSMPKLREKYDQLQKQAKAQRDQSAARPLDRGAEILRAEMERAALADAAKEQQQMMSERRGIEG